MSMFGKFMAVLNFLGVVTLLVLALLVYSKRRAWEYAVYRQDLARYGIAVSQDDLDEQDYLRYLDLGEPTGTTLKDLLPSNPVVTQVQEVERVKSILDGKVREVNANAVPEMDLLALTLLPLSATNSQRDYYLAIRAHAADDKALAALRTKMEAAYPKAVEAVKADPKKLFANEFGLALRFPGPVPNKLTAPPKGAPVLADGEPRRPFEDALVREVQPEAGAAANLTVPFDEAFTKAVETVRGDLRQQYEAAFEEALKGKHGGKDISLDQRRHAISHLLIALDTALPKDEALDANAFNTPAFDRILRIVGVQEMNRALTAEAFLLTRISQEQDKDIERERTAFILTHQALITEANSSAQSLAQQDEQLKRLRERVEEEKTLVAQRQKNVTDSQTELAARRKYTADLIEIVRQMTDGIHATRIAVRDANTLNQGYVEKIKTLELKR